MAMKPTKMRGGGMVKKMSGGAVKKMPDGMVQAMKKGGTVKKSAKAKK
tara:strand:+ start:371 stop:514 length:144 start_codon:yes stop_codon:yes gene_type:complete